ncbi:SusC/RagA family TonB-linked outer membrane protein [Hallella bergensis]|uniref:SusC/RagA family TonB-linked outer membrane protein n=1 Tax=Hallella bergensis TaxID=242750 RepID=UPI00399081BD
MNKWSKRSVALFIASCAMSATTFAQGIIKGEVKDENGQPLIGATVMEEGTENGVVTNIDGRFSISVKPGKKLRISYVGYKSSVVIVHSGDNKIILKEEGKNLNELVVVGYGMQHKRDLVGTVSQVGGEVLENRANPNVTRSLQGEIPGLTITMTDGKPIRSGNIKIRGAVNSIGAGGNALILVDGVEGDLNAVNPEDVESVSVLKDASTSAIYGARGAFGVILVTTKKAKKGAPVVRYSGNVSLQRRTVRPETVNNGLEWATNFYTAYVNQKGTIPSVIGNVFNKGINSWEDWYGELKKRDADPTLEKMRTNKNGYYEYYGNTDWFGRIYKDNSYATQHNLSVSGGNDIATYLLSGGYNFNNGVYSEGGESFKRYNLRAKGSIRIRPWLLLENNAEFWQRKYHEPAVMYAYYPTDMSSLIPIQRQMEQQLYPMTLEKNLDGTWTEASVYSGWAGFCDGDSWREYKDMRIRNTSTLTADILKDVLQAKADFTYNHYHATRNQVGNLYTGYRGPDIPVVHQSFSYLENRFYDTDYLSSNVILTFTPKLGEEHHFSAMGGWNIEDEKYKSTRIERNNLLVKDKPNFNLTDGDAYYINDNGSYSWGFIGVFYRLNYNWKGRYLIETSGRYDGSSKFPADQKWGFFPSVSVGWRVSDEKFMHAFHESFLDNMKIRLSAGSAGNGLVSPYQYLSTMSVATSNVVANGQLLSYTNAPTPVPTGLTWEKTATYNIGVDVDMFKGRLGLTFDIYRKNITNMYVVGQELPAVYGNSAPKGNNADLRTNGWEASLSWRDHFYLAGKPFNWSVKASVWDATSKITKYTSTTNTLPTIYATHYYEGMTIGEIWGYEADGFFQSKEDVLNSPSQSYFANYKSAGTVWEAGDLKFKDLNDDKYINPGNGTLSNHGDLKVIGNTTPRYCYSFSLSGNWNGIGLSMFWQGVGKRDWYPARESSLFWGQYSRPYSFDLPWQDGNNCADIDEEGNIVNAGAYWPRKRGWIAQMPKGILSNANTMYLQNAAYLRLKNVTLSYEFPKTLIRSMKLSQLRLYVTGENLLTFTPLHKHAKNFDPEVISAGDHDGLNKVGVVGEGYSYPMMKTYTVGLNITF